MKKKLFALFLCIGLSGCISSGDNNLLYNKENKMEYDVNTENVKNNAIIMKPKRNVDCIYDIKDVEIFQTLGKKDGLAIYKRGDKYSLKTALFSLPYTFIDEIKLYDGLKVEVPNGQCFVIQDTYKYKTKGGDDKVVPIITFDYEFTPSNKEEAFKRLQKTLNYEERLATDVCNGMEDSKLKQVGYSNVGECVCRIISGMDVSTAFALLVEMNMNDETNYKKVILNTYGKEVIIEDLINRYGKFLSIKNNSDFYIINNDKFFEEFSEKIDKKCGTKIATKKTLKKPSQTKKKNK